MSADLQIFARTDRRNLEAGVVKPFIDDPDFRKRSVLESVSQSDFEAEDIRKLYGEIQISTLAGKTFSYVGSEFEEVVLEILSGPNFNNGQWSQAVQRLKVHRFDRVNFPLSDLGNAERFQQQHGATVKYDHTRHAWLIWDGHKWGIDETDEIISMMASSLRGRYSDAENLETETERKAAVKWALLCESRSKIADALKLAQSLPGIRTSSTDFDLDQLLVNCRNVTLDLRSMNARQHDHRDMMTKSLSVDYDEDATCQWFENYLSELFDADNERILFLQQSCGLALSGTTDEQFLWFPYGGGLNGKTTFTKIITGILGSYHLSAPANMLLVRKGEGANNDVARLHGARLVTCQEIESGRRLAESQVKSLTGGDRIVARFLYGEYFEFEPSHKIWLIANHKPIITGTDEAIWRRVLLVPFLKQIPPEKRRPMAELLRMAEREGPGILNWMIEGWTSYKQHGLQIPERVRAATRSYRQESDTLRQFIEECTTDSGEVSTTDLYTAFKSWSGDSALSQKALFNAMVEKGFQLRPGTRRKRFWQGVGLLAERE